ncbi:MAG: Hpt domain-containing protein [Gammaproteobacteria bacterium]|nr:Hpt domain-containing protein [Gammaproteobacteria bacterium]
MATSREHFALDWIRGELLETLSTARAGLEAFAEAVENGTAPQQAAGEDPMRACVNGLHQVHGTLVMLELKGVTLLADHLERVAERLMAGEVTDVSGACQSLMQGILELPGYLDELRSGVPDSDTALLPLVNELRGHLGEAPVEDRHAAAVRLHGAASDAALGRFDAIGGAEKTRKIRTAYQQVLLGLLKGGAPSRALDTLRKVAQGMSKVCEGTPFEFQWQAFGEFVESLASEDAERLDNDAVKLLRRVDSEIREIGQTGRAALQRPVPVALIRQLLDAAAARGRSSPLLTELSDAAAQGDASGASGASGTMSLSGKQALVSAASALREEIGTIKDRLDLFVRSGRGDTAELNELLAPLKQIGSTLSLLGFESSRSIVLDQVDALSALVEGHDSSEPAILNVAGALVQVDENLAGLTHAGKGEVEKITDDAHRAVAQQTRDDLDRVKQSIVDYVSSQWDVRHLQDTAAALDGIAGALGMIPLTRAAELLQRCRQYVHQELLAGHVPSWEELDRLADALSGIDYYLERLASENPGGAEDVLELAQRSLDGLSASAEPADATPADAPRDDAPPVSEELVVEEPVAQEPSAEEAPVEAFPGEEHEADADAALYGAAEQVDVAALDESADAAEPELEMEADEDFDLSNELFDDLVEDSSATEATPAGTGTGEPEPAAESAEQEPAAPETQETAPAAATASASAAAAVASLADDFDSDDEIVEIFSEEVDEVLEAIDEHLPPWQAALEDEARQTEIRRAFHTLKGSGRMVGANILGEMAWSVENMLNRLLDGTVTLTAEFPAVVQEARQLVPVLRDAFEQKSAPDMGAVARIMEQADMLASGGALADTADHAEPAEAASASEQAAAADDDRNLFIDEARNHIDTLAGASRGDAFVLGDDAMRALHTLSGSAAMAGLAAVAELAAPAYELAQALRRPGTQTELSGEAAEFFRQATQAMAATLDDMQAGREPEEQFQLIAEADRLLMGAGEAARSDALLGLPAVTSLMKAPGFLDAWLDGTVDMAQADELREALAEIERTAQAEGQSARAGLAGALRGAHGRFEFETLTAPAHEVFARGHEALLAQFDALAADQTPDPATAAGDAPPRRPTRRSRRDCGRCRRGAGRCRG